MVIFKQTTKPLPASNFTVSIRGHKVPGEQPVSKTLMVSLSVIVLNKFSDRMAKLGFGEEDDSIQAFKLGLLPAIVHSSRQRMRACRKLKRHRVTRGSPEPGHAPEHARPRPLRS